MIKKIVLFFLILINYTHIFATSFPVFPLSTEMQIHKIGNLVNKAPSGLFLTVGGERAFRGGSLFRKIEHLMIIDISPEIIRFCKINIELLKAQNKEIYKNLRWNSSFTEWKNLSDKVTEEDFDWWNTHVRNIQHYPVPEELNRHGVSLYYQKYLKIYQRVMLFYEKIANKFNKNTKAYLKNVLWEDITPLHFQNEEARSFEQDFEWFDQERKNEKSCVNMFIENPSQVIDLGQVVDYKSGNYLFDDKMYQRLHNLVLENKITVLQADLAQDEDLNRLYSMIKGLNLKISVLDFDNLFAYEYMGEEKFRVAVEHLIELGDNDSILVLMHNYKRYACVQFSIYLGFTFENFRTWPREVFFYSWIHDLPPDVYSVIDGRLYEQNEQLPLTLIMK